MSGGLVVGYREQSGPDVLTFGRAWARTTGEPLTVVAVYPAPFPISQGRVDAEWVAYNREEAERLLDQARAGLGDVPATFRSVAADSASHGLSDVVEAEAPAEGATDAVLVIGSRRTRGLRRTAPGSTAERLLQGSPVPVVLVPWAYEDAGEARLERVSVAFVDTADGRAALRGAVALARRLHARLEVLSVVPDTRVAPALGDRSAFGREQRAGYQAALDAALDGLPDDLGATGRLLDGPVVDALVDLAPTQTDLLVCGSRGYGPARRVLLGGVSSRVLRHARVPVAVVPRG